MSESFLAVCPNSGSVFVLCQEGLRRVRIDPPDPRVPFATVFTRKWKYHGPPPEPAREAAVKPDLQDLKRYRPRLP
jgi:hypothetical protein